MGNENEHLDKESKEFKKMRDEAIRNDKKIKQAFAGEGENSDQDDNEMGGEKEKEIDDYDKEISKMLFDEEAELDEGERLKKNRQKRDKKAELKSYAEQIAEEQFMEEINRSKSVNKMPRKRVGGASASDEDSDEDDFDSYQKWRERKNRKKNKKEVKNKKNNIKIEENDYKENANNIRTERNKNNNIKIEVNDDEDNTNNIRTERNNKKKRNISSNKSPNQKNYYTESNINTNGNNLNIKTEIVKKKKKSGFGGFFNFGKKKKENEQENKEENYQFNQYKSMNSSPQINYSFNPMQQPPQMNYNPINNMPSQNYNAMNSTPMTYNQMNPQAPNYSQIGGNPMAYTQMYNPSNNMTPIGGTPGMDPYMTSNPGAYNQFQSAQSILEPTQPTKSKFSFFGKKQAISKKVYAKVKPEDLNIVLMHMKYSNNKYQEGLDLCGQRKYNEALTCFGHARYSLMNLNKVINSNPRAYPTEFKMVISKKSNEKLSLILQSIRECNSFIKNKNTQQILKNPETAQDILRNINNANKNNNNDNFNFGNMNNNMSNNMDNNINNNNMNNNNKDNKKKNIHEKEEDEMDEKIESEIMVKNPGVKFDDIIGMKEMKRILYEIIVVPTIRPDLFTGIRKPQRGILLFGPPGTGKTMIAKAIASECNSTFFNISASSLTSKWVGESEKTVKSLFKLAYKKTPSIIFIDEIDSILSKRNESENEATKRLKTEFLIQFDGLGSNTNARLLVIAATNRPMDLDEALLRRLPKRVYCGPLDEEGRFEFIKKVINRVECRLSDRDIQEVARMTNGYSNSDLKELCKEAAYQPVRELTMDQILHIDKFRPLYKKDLVKACNKIRGTLSHKVIDELLVWNEQFGGV